jgi:hypothetical protein
LVILGGVMGDVAFLHLEEVPLALARVLAIKTNPHLGALKRKRHERLGQAAADERGRLFPRRQRERRLLKELVVC